MTGGAVGDALGFPIEFFDIQSIRSRYGQQGLTRYILNDKDVAEISDDTQMSLFTANGLLWCITQHEMNAGFCRSMESCMEDAYDEWYQTQTGRKNMERNICWIRDIPELNNRRAPGMTCMSALRTLREGGKVLNDSKGCGGVMRVAPLALFPYGNYGDRHVRILQSAKIDHENIDVLGIEAARITHKHSLGFLTAGLSVHIIHKIVNRQEGVFPDLEKIIEEALETLEGKEYLEDEIYLKKLVRQAIRLSGEADDDVIAIGSLGEGWTGEEALAIALYCMLKYRHDFEKAVVAAVNHSGDSDSTGAITGNFMGALLGRKAIPEYYTANLELLPVIEEISRNLFTGCIIGENQPLDTQEKQRWYKKYGEIKKGINYWL
jgi:ADP-ribosylglycohydrolase